MLCGNTVGQVARVMLHCVISTWNEQLQRWGNSWEKYNLILLCAMLFATNVTL